MTEPETEASAKPAPRDVWFWIATWFGSGLAPKAPGTFGSAASLVLWAPIVLLDGSPVFRVAAAVAVFALGVVASDRVARATGRSDPQIVVVDEVAGMGITLALARPEAVSLALGFALFRLFDITKPWPVRWADRRVKGGLGVMLDDVLAGLYALGCLFCAERFLLP